MAPSRLDNPFPSPYNKTISPERRTLMAHFGCKDETGDSFYIDEDDCLWSRLEPEPEFRIPWGVREIGVYAFEYDESIETLILPDTVKIIHEGAFSECKNLRRVYLPDSLEKVGEAAFFGCQNLQDVRFPRKQDYVLYDHSAFSETGFTRIKVPAHFGTVWDGVFSVCEQLEEVVLEEGIHSLKGSAFWACPNLKKVTFPASLKRIDPYAFIDCPEFEAVCPPGSYAETWLKDRGAADRAAREKWLEEHPYCDPPW